jgi:two-component system chemotaxis response regulator CheB
MFSTLTERGAAVTLDALALGASDWVTKPANVGGITQAMQRVREQLIPKIKALCAPAIPGLKQALARLDPAPPRRVLQARPTGVSPIEVVAIGVSTGGPQALAKVLPEIPAEFPVPVVIVQHMPPLFTKLLAERLSAQCQIGVSEGAAGDRLRPAHAWIAPGDNHMILTQAAAAVQVQLNRDPPENSCRPAVDVLFRSVAAVYGGRVLGVVLTGMGQDGLRGSEAICDAGGHVLAQDEATSVVWGMPGFVAKAGLADRVLPLSQVGPEIVRRVLASRARPEIRMQAGTVR